MTPASAPV